MFMASGEEVLSIQVEDFLQMTSEEERPVRVLALKRHLQHLCGQPRFRQRLLLPQGQILSEDVVIEGPMDAQLILQSFEPSSEEQILSLYEAAIQNNILAMEPLLQRPQDPASGLLLRNVK